jgi:hypothetical protein
VVGWIGSPTTFPYLEGLAGVLADVARRHPFTLKVSGAGRAVNFPGVTVREVPWSMADEVSLFNTCDIGVYPLTDDEWSKGKCGFKAIQCMACGVPWWHWWASIATSSGCEQLSRRRRRMGGEAGTAADRPRRGWPRPGADHRGAHSLRVRRRSWPRSRGRRWGPHGPRRL